MAAAGRGFERLNRIRIQTEGKTRDKPVSKEYLQKLDRILKQTDPRLGAVITSGGQAPKGSKGKRTGSTRHDVDHTGHSHTSDLVLTLDGKEIRPGQNKEMYSKFIENAAREFPGIGHYSWGIHVGGGSEAFWGPTTGSASADPMFKKAFQRGRKSRGQGTEPTPSLPGGGGLLSLVSQNLDAPANADQAVAAPIQELLRGSLYLAGRSSGEGAGSSTPSAGAGGLLGNIMAQVQGEGSSGGFLDRSGQSLDRFANTSQVPDPGAMGSGLGAGMEILAGLGTLFGAFGKAADESSKNAPKVKTTMLDAARKKRSNLPMSVAGIQNLIRGR